MRATPVLRLEPRALGSAFYAVQREFSPRPGTSVRHSHADFHEIFGVVHGSGIHDLEAGQHPLSAGDVVLVRPRDRHRFRGLPPAGLTIANVSFPSHAWRTFASLTGLDSDGQWEHGAFPPVFRLRGAAANTMHKVFRYALVASQPSPTMFDLIRFWTDLFEIPGMRGEENSDRPGIPAWLTHACGEMRREENLRGGVARLRELAHVSAAHMARSMRQHYGVTPTQFITDLRLQHAATLLASTTESVTTIAFRCGFSSQAYFSRSFQAAHGSPPREFRRQAVRAFLP